MTATEPDPDDVFADLAAQLGDIDTSTVVDYTKLTDAELVDAFTDVRDQLGEIEEMYADTGLTPKPSTFQGRELHSQRAAILIEMRKRNLG